MFCRLRYTITLPLLQDCDPGTANGLLTVFPTYRDVVSLIDQEVWIGAVGICKESHALIKGINDLLENGN